MYYYDTETRFFISAPLMYKHVPCLIMKTTPNVTFIQKSYCVTVFLSQNLATIIWLRNDN